MSLGLVINEPAILSQSSHMAGYVGAGKSGNWSGINCRLNRAG